LIFDQAGNLYGTTLYGGTRTVLYSFLGGSDGAMPQAGLIFDKAGNLYGTTSEGGDAACNGGCGTTFELSPESGGAWTESLLYSFQGEDSSDGAYPRFGLILDQAGNLYGTTPEPPADHHVNSNYRSEQ
jgi:uncharacterized repeat protein (TIGR03803 family)